MSPLLREAVLTGHLSAPRLQLPFSSSPGEGDSQPGSAPLALQSGSKTGSGGPLGHTVLPVSSFFLWPKGSDLGKPGLMCWGGGCRDVDYPQSHHLDLIKGQRPGRTGVIRCQRSRAGSLGRALD